MPLQEKGSHVDQTLPLEIIRASLASIQCAGAFGGTQRVTAGHNRKVTQIRCLIQLACSAARDGRMARQIDCVCN
jgi:hypothetical protein